MVQIRPAKKSDAENIAELMYSAGPELYDFIYKVNAQNSLAYIQYEFNSGKGFCGYKNVTVAVKDGKIVGTGCFYDGLAYKGLLMGTILNMFKFYGPMKIWTVILRSSHIGSVMAKPKEDELYLSNFGVSPELRGTGIGGAILKNKIDYAISAGYRIFSLDVAETNPRAEALYIKHGLSVIKHKKFTGSRPGIVVPNAKKMELALGN